MDKSAQEVLTAQQGRSPDRRIGARTMASTAIVSHKRTVVKEVAILGAVLVALIASAALAFGILPFGP